MQPSGSKQGNGPERPFGLSIDCGKSGDRQANPIKEEKRAKYFETGGDLSMGSKHPPPGIKPKCNEDRSSYHTITDAHFQPLNVRVGSP